MSIRARRRHTAWIARRARCKKEVQRIARRDAAAQEVLGCQRIHPSRKRWTRTLRVVAVSRRSTFVTRAITDYFRTLAARVQTGPQMPTGVRHRSALFLGVVSSSCWGLAGTARRASIYINVSGVKFCRLRSPRGCRGGVAKVAQTSRLNLLTQ